MPMPRVTRGFRGQRAPAGSRTGCSTPSSSRDVYKRQAQPGGRCFGEDARRVGFRPGQPRPRRENPRREPYSFLNMYSIFGDSVIKKFTSNVAKAYNLFPRKGALLPGADADIVIFDDSVTDTIKDNTSLYNGIEIQGKIVKVYLGGNCVVNNGKYIISRGKYIKR